MTTGVLLAVIVAPRLAVCDPTTNMVGDEVAGLLALEPPVANVSMFDEGWSAEITRELLPTDTTADGAATGLEGANTNDTGEVAASVAELTAAC